MESAAGRSVGPPAVAITLWGLQALTATYWIFAYQYADDDTGFAVRLARACLERGACATAGMPTSGLGLSHGVTWIRLIGYSLTTGAGLGTVQMVALALLIAATILSSIVVWQAVSWRAGMFASLLVLPGTMATLRFDDLTNGTLLPLPLALYYAGTAWFVQSGSMPAVLAASFALGAALSPSLSCILLLPLHVALVALTSRKPLVAAPSAALAVAVTFAIESSTAATQLARLLWWPSLVVIGLLLVVGLAAAFWQSVATPVRRAAEAGQNYRRRFLAMSAPVRLRAAMKLAAAYLVTAGWTVPTIAGRLRFPDAHFFAPAVFPLVFLAAEGTQSMSGQAAWTLIGVAMLALVALRFAPFAVGIGSVLCVVTAALLFLFLLARALRYRDGLGRDLEAHPSGRVALGAAVLVCLMCLPDALIYPRTPQVWPVRTAVDIVRGLYDSGFTFPELMGALQEPAPYTIDSMIANLDPHVFGDPPMMRDSTLSLLAMIVDPAVAARSRDVVMRVDTAAGRAAIAIRSTSVLDRSRLRTCYAKSCDEPIDPQRCITREPSGPMRHDRPYFPVDKIETPAAGSLFSYQPSGTTYCIRFSIPLRLSGTGEPHWLRVPELWPLPLQTRIRQVSGASYDGIVPGPEVRLRNDQRGSGSVEIEVSARGFGPESNWLEQPPLVEVDDANEHLLELYRHGRVTWR